jgi:hypothetical protein
LFHDILSERKEIICFEKYIDEIIKGKTKWPHTLPKHIFSRNAIVKALETFGGGGGGRSGCDRMVVGCTTTTTYAINAYYH